MSFDVSKLSFTGDSVPAPGGAVQDIALSSDETRVYFLGRDTDTITQFNLSEPGVLSSKVSEKSFTFTADRPQGFVFTEDGTRVFIAERPSTIRQLTLSVAWEIDSATQDAVTLDVSGQTNFCEALDLKDDGKVLYLAESTNNQIHSYNLTTPNSLDGASFSGTSIGAVSGVEGMDFLRTGEAVLLLGESSTTIVQFDLTDPWLLSSASDSDLRFDTSSEGTLLAAYAPEGAESIYVYGDMDGMATSWRYSTGFEFGPSTNEELFQASYADASAADPKVTALIRPADVQRSIDTDVSNLAGGPNLYVVEAIFDIGELSDLNPYNATTEKPRVFFVKDDQPGLRQGKNLLLKGYTIRDADPSVPVTCTFWGP